LPPLTKSQSEGRFGRQIKVLLGWLGTFSGRLRSSIPLLIILFVGILIPITWYHSGELLVSGDFNSPFNPGRVFVAMWSGWSNAMGMGGGSTIQLLPIDVPYYAILALFHFVGLSPALGELFTFSLIFASAGFSMWLLLRQWFGNGSAAFVGGFVYMLNPFTLIEWHNGFAIEMIGWGLAPLVLLLVDKACTRKTVSLKFWLAVAIVAFLLAAGASNVASLFGFILLPCILMFACRWETYRLAVNSYWRTLRRLGLMLVTAVAMNMWWVLPTVSGASLIPGFASQVDTTSPPDMVNPMNAFNLITGWGFWGWHAGYQGAPYFTFEPWYRGHPMQLLVLTPLLLGLAAFARRGSRDWSTFRNFGIVCFLIALPLAAAWHGPFGNLWEWAYRHVPGFVAFRSPWERFAGLEWLGLAVLMAVLFSRSATESEAKKKRVLRWSGAALAIIVMIGVTFPIFGQMFENRGTNGRWIEYSKVPPTYVTQFASAVKGESRCEVLDPEWYFETYVPLRWYRGGITNVNFLLPCEVLGADAHPYLDGQVVANTIDNYIVSNGKRSDLIHFIEAIGVTDILVANDYAYSVYGFGPTSHDLETYLSGAGLTRHGFGEWIDFRLPYSLIRGNLYVADQAVPHGSLAGSKTSGIMGLVRAIGLSDGQAVITKQAIQLSTGASLRVNGSHESEIRNLTGNVIIGSNTSFAPGWRLTVRPVGEASVTPTVSHIEINGYANGWILKGRGSYDLTTSYFPSSLIIVGGSISILTVLALLSVWLFEFYNREPRRRVTVHSRHSRKPN